MHASRPTAVALRAALATLVMVLAGVTTALTTAGAQSFEPYADPPWADDCAFVHYGEGEAPALGELDDDPLCIRYDKQEITVDDGGALGFLLAEPARLAAAVPACRYWQQDRWSVQLSAGDLALVSWEGSYWFDLGAGQAGAMLRDFQVAGVPAGADQVADLLEPVDADLAATIRAHGGGPGGGASGLVDFGSGDPTCPARAGGDPTTGDPADGDPGTGSGSEADGPAPPGATGGAASAPPGDAARALPLTGGGALPAVAAAGLAAAALAVRLLLGRTRTPR